MVEVIKRKKNRRSREHEEHLSLGFWGSLLSGAIFVCMIVLMAVPNSEDEQPPPGVKTYIDGNLECWDKVVCCNPNDKSTCASIPICEMID